MHDAGHGSEGMVIFCKMFGEAGCVWVVSEGCLMFFITDGEPSAGLSDVRSVAIWAGVCIPLTLRICLVGCSCG